jgi:hypothetical protein
MCGKAITAMLSRTILYATQDSLGALSRRRDTDQRLRIHSTVVYHESISIG